MSLVIVNKNIIDMFFIISEVYVHTGGGDHNNNYYNYYNNKNQKKDGQESQYKYLLM